MTIGAARATTAMPKKPNNRLREITSDIRLSFGWLERQKKPNSFRESAHTRPALPMLGRASVCRAHSRCAGLACGCRAAQSADRYRVCLKLPLELETLTLLSEPGCERPIR